MCGIFGYIGNDSNSVLRAIRGLKDLEYRGYDSWGVAVKESDGIYINKDTGKISKVDSNNFKDVQGNISIGHSRWATHGGVTRENAHPHISSNERVAVVHNGIIENYQELKKELTDVSFVSETDTEVIAQLVGKYIDEGLSTTDSFIKTLTRLEGRYSIVLISKDEDIILAARNGSPLILGKGTDGYFVASDIPAFLDYTNIVNYIDDGEYCVLDTKGVSVYEFNTGKLVEKKDVEISWDKDSASKGDWDHYMIKEIMEQKESIARAINQDEKEIDQITDLIKSSDRLLLSACGTAGNVCRTGQYFFSKIAEMPSVFAPSSEIQFYKPYITDKTLLIVVSQSGETADVLEAMEHAKSSGAKVLAIVNVKGSSVDRMADYTLLINAGPEKAVASTKAATGQLTILMMLAYAAADKLEDGKRELVDALGKINDWLNPNYLLHVREVAQKLKDNEHMYIIGRGELYPIAREATIKIQEVSYIHAEGFAGGELKHGPIALIEEGTPILAFVAQDETKADIFSNIEELKARGAHIVAIAPEDNSLFDQWLFVPSAGDVNAIVSLIPAQILAYYLAILRGHDPDMPRNLAKSVTVK